MLRYFQSTFPQLRPLKPMEGIADFVVDVTSQAAKEEKRRAPEQHRGQQRALRRRRGRQQQQDEPSGNGDGAAGDGRDGMGPLRFADRYQESKLRVECEQQIQVCWLYMRTPEGASRGCAEKGRNHVGEQLELGTGTCLSASAACMLWEQLGQA